MRAAVQVDSGVPGPPDDPRRGNEPRGGPGRPDLEHLAPAPEPGPNEAPQEDQQGAVAGLGPAARTEAGARLLPIAEEGGEPPPARQTRHPARACHRAILRRWGRRRPGPPGRAWPQRAPG
jgi:hypothetical protein